MKTIFLLLLTVVGCHAVELSIVECDFRKNDPGPDTLQAAIASRNGERVDINRVQLRVCIFERSSRAKLAPASANISFRWIKPPATRKNNFSEQFEVIYPGPIANSRDTYAGYAVAVYYDGVLQESRHSSKTIFKRFPFPKTLAHSP